MSLAVAIPEGAELSVKIEFSSRFNITPYVAQQEVDDILLSEVGNLLYAEEPEALLDEAGVFWRVPVAYALPSHGKLGIVGSLLVDAKTGEVRRSEATLKAIRRNAEALYHTHASATAAGV